jgi:hypothetical protein
MEDMTMQATKATKTIVFSHDKNGRKIAFRVGRDWRLFRVALAGAEIDVATGAATDESAGWRNHFARLANDRAPQEGRKPTARCTDCNDFCFKVGGVHGC